MSQHLLFIVMIAEGFTPEEGHPPRSALARLYLSGESMRHRSAVALDAIWSGVWLGMLGERDFHAIDAAYYEQRPSYRTLEHNRHGLFEWEEHALTRHFPTSGSIRLIGAGGGREVLALLERGFAVEAYECNPALLQSANELLASTGAAARIAYLARDCSPPAAATCDGVIVGWSAYMLINGRRRRIAFLRDLRQGLAARTPLLLSFFTRTGTEKRLDLLVRVANMVRRLRGAEPVEAGDDLTTIYVHRFTQEDVHEELSAAGFQLVEYRQEGPGGYDSGFAVARATG
ncbi:MAG: putative methyltransferase [Gemmatimonadetes bacterium]|nr:putative methyltransferase [Gemmatimonadota bacterium]